MMNVSDSSAHIALIVLPQRSTFRNSSISIAFNFQVRELVDHDSETLSLLCTSFVHSVARSDYLKLASLILEGLYYPILQVNPHYLLHNS